MPTAAVMNRRVHKIFNLLFAFLLIFVSATACAATPEKFGTRAEFVQIQERVKVLEQELANQKRTLDLNLEMNNKRLEMGDKRLADFGALATMQSSHTTWVGIGITVIVAIAGFLTFLNATGRAQGEARHWIERNSKELKERIRELELEANTARAAIAFHADSAKKSIDADAKKVRDAAKEVMATDAGSETSLRDRTPGTTELVQEASKELQAKPERDFTASEHYVRGVSSYSEGNLQNALASFESAIRKAGNSPPAELAEYLFGRAFLLGTLGKIEEEIAGYNEIVQRFGADTTPGVREQVTRGMNNKGFRLGQQGKADEEIAVYNEIVQRFGADTTPGVREQVALAMNSNQSGTNKAILDKA
ncbi:MAG: tol-pal system protein YbgF [Herminiimonas sp.]|nr:tol-pal system protein YbgF [Herminiimonas sp.]